MIEVRICCDKCNATMLHRLPVCGYYPTKQAVISDALYLSFTVGKKILCPDCNKKPNPHKAEYELLKMKGRERK